MLTTFKIQIMHNYNLLVHKKVIYAYIIKHKNEKKKKKKKKEKRKNIKKFIKYAKSFII